MQSNNIFPPLQGMKSVALVLLCLAMLAFPFSVAASNVLLGALLVAGLLSGLWWRGVSLLWQEHRLLSQVMIAYLVLVLMGIGWSADFDFGLKIIGRHWFWMMIPVLVALLLDSKYRMLLLIALSIGLTLNLVFCVLQMFELILSPSVAGSSPANATGHIGHTSFGFIYGIWAAWLLHVGLGRCGSNRWLLWSLAAWALIMIFMAQGKSGYIVSLLMICVVAVKWLQETGSKRLFAGFVAVLMLLLAVLAFGPGKERVQGVWQVFSETAQQQVNNEQKKNADQTTAVSSATARLAWWQMSYELWLDAPLLGVGTGGFPSAASEWMAAQNKAGEFNNSAPAHPHNQYLLSMVRWGLVGLLCLLALLYVWIRTGFRYPWQDSIAIPLIALSGTALLAHGLSSASLEEHFSTIFAIVVFSAGLSECTHS